MVADELLLTFPVVTIQISENLFFQATFFTDHFIFTGDFKFTGKFEVICKFEIYCKKLSININGVNRKKIYKSSSTTMWEMQCITILIIRGGGAYKIKFF